MVSGRLGSPLRASAVQGLQVEPVLALQHDETHAWPRCGFGYTCGVIVVFLCTHFRALRSKGTTVVMRDAACLHATVQGLSLSASSTTVARLTRRRWTTRSSASRPRPLLRFLPRLIPRVTMVMGSILSLIDTGIKISKPGAGHPLKTAHAAEKQHPDVLRRHIAWLYGQLDLGPER